MSRSNSLLGLLGRAPTVWRTLVHMRPAQAWAQLHYMLLGLPEPRRLTEPAPTLAVAATDASFLAPPAHVKGGRTQVELLRRTLPLGERVDWESERHGPLFAYHLHQQEYLRLASFSPADRAATISDWIGRHPTGTGWDPHPISLRLLCWGKLLLTPGALPEDEAFRGAILLSLADQAATLAAGLEVRLQANHLLSNLLAVVWTGLLVDGSDSEKWRGHTDRFVDELKRQIHPDGGHEERSPMYHALLLESLLDLLNLGLRPGLQANLPTGLGSGATLPSRASAELIDVLRSTAGRMLVAFEVMTHPDGRLALFADSAFDLSSPLRALADYAARLGVEPRPSAEAHPATSASALLPQTGYLRLVSREFHLIASVAGPAPAHQPGHAHCDALSFELSVAGRRLITDTGLYEYRPGKYRDRARATSSHSTIEIEGQEQAEVWSAHRVGGRPEVALAGWDGAESAEATCRGWSKQAPLHRRAFRVGETSCVIEDQVDGTSPGVVSRLFFAPGWTLDLASGVATARSEEKGAAITVLIELPASFDWTIERAPYYPSFGCEEERAVLVGRAAGSVEAALRFRALR